MPNLRRPEEEKSSWHQFHKPGKERAQSTRQSANAWAKTAHGASGRVHTKNKGMADSECGSPDAFRLNLWEFVQGFSGLSHDDGSNVGPNCSVNAEALARCHLGKENCQLLVCLDVSSSVLSRHSHFAAGVRSVNLHLLPQDPSHASNCLPFLLSLASLVCHADNVVLATDDEAELPPTIAFFSGATSTSSGHLGSVCVSSAAEAPLQNCWLDLRKPDFHWHVNVLPFSCLLPLLFVHNLCTASLTLEQDLAPPFLGQFWVLFF